MKGTRRLLTRLPAMPSRAGSSVTAAIIVMATISADAQPIIVIIGMPDTCRPAMASTTVEPAKSTERPAVAFAPPIASGTGVPDSRFCRCRARMNSA